MEIYRTQCLYFPFLLNTFSLSWDGSYQCPAYCPFLAYYSFYDTRIVTLQGWRLTEAPECDKGAVTGGARPISNQCFAVC